MKTITFFFVSCFVLFSSLGAKAEINYIPNVVHGFNIIADIKQHRLDCKTNSGTWYYKRNQFCQNTKLDVVSFRPEKVFFTEFFADKNKKDKYTSVIIHYYMIDEYLGFYKYVENEWLEYLHQTYGEPNRTSCNNNDYCTWNWFFLKDNFVPHGMISVSSYIDYGLHSGMLNISYTKLN